MYTIFEDGCLLTSYDVFIADTLRYVVTLTFDLLTLIGYPEFFCHVV